jgi:hypothetical protein
MSRPRSIFPCEATLWDLAYLGCSDREIADTLGFHQSLFCKRSDLAAVVAKARSERAEAISVLWNSSSQGALRPEGRGGRLTELVRAAERRSIQRNRPDHQLSAISSGQEWSSERQAAGAEQRKNSGEASGEDAKRSTISTGKIGQSEGTPTR